MFRALAYFIPFIFLSPEIKENSQGLPEGEPPGPVSHPEITSFNSYLSESGAPQEQGLSSFKLNLRKCA